MVGWAGAFIPITEDTGEHADTGMVIDTDTTRVTGMATMQVTGLDREMPTGMYTGTAI
jgi:hypothetical protein